MAWLAFADELPYRPTRVLIAGSSDGSLLKSTDGGSSWTSVHSGKSVPTAIVFSRASAAPMPS